MGFSDWRISSHGWNNAIWIIDGKNLLNQHCVQMKKWMAIDYRTFQNYYLLSRSYTSEWHFFHCQQNGVSIMVQVALGPDASGEKVRSSALHHTLKWNQEFITSQIWRKKNQCKTKNKSCTFFFPVVVAIDVKRKKVYFIRRMKTVKIWL